MRRTLFTTVAAGALSLGLSAAFAQTGAPSGGSETAPGQMKPPATSAAPGASESAPGQNRPSVSTNAPGQSERAPGQTRDAGSTASTSSQDGGAGSPSRPAQQGSSPSQPSSSSTASDTKASPSGTQPRTGQSAGSGSGSSAQPQSGQAGQSSSGQSTASQPSANPSSSGQSSSRTGTDNQGQAQSTTGTQQRSTTGSSQPQGATSSTTQSSQPQGGTSATTQPSQTGSAGSASVTSATANLSTQERSQVTQSFTSARVEPATNVNFSISVGSSVTEEVRLYDVPADVVRVVPQYRGYRYFVVRDEIVIVEPRTKKIVEVIHKSGRNSASMSKAKSSVKLSAEQRKSLRSSVETTGSTRTTRTTIDLREGLTLPEDVELYDVPTTIVSEEPELRTYRYVVIGDEIGLVDPQTRQVVTIVEE